ncbi:uncharacterized protein BX663DRAFT_512051 [Cokeromyces recurvatus]|uniref:uncharacterized protein n=1 Tax=Cokeromyces recurvatus TaxID=90255 RepID=UPI0022208EA2|nr:uncharacterized protein BX663DRAFT_512051 [Cokeromyces recurvatus]KAI7902196.1 hypothetical protein BX663DRAFT_512051 [Cokeromyces recurvatus]
MTINIATNKETTLENKRKKASRACFHCQRAHLTCDDSRPCQRCIKRDLANTCADAVRKRAKYLQDILEDEFFSNTSSTSSTPILTLDNDRQTVQTSSLNNNNDLSSIDSQQHYTVMEPITASIVNTNDNNLLFDFSLPNLGFVSEAIELEYGFLSNMLQNPLLTVSPNNIIPTTTATSSSSSSAAATSTATATSTSTSTATTATMTTTPIIHHYSTTNTTTIKSPTSIYAEPYTTSFLLYQQNKLSPTTNSNAVKKARITGRRKGIGYTPKEAYQNVESPFNYAEGFHYLIQYVKEKMSNDDLMKISRALAYFRPSFLALIMNLTEEDLIFMEKCIQRTLLEYEKLISFSGTPTVIWRRTGEICLVGKEFSLLTQWTKDMLLGKRIYIYELMDSQSAVEYWEKFATHAFDNADKSCIFSCIVKTPQQTSVPCTFCFTIKRDIFDLPSVIIGNFLPILC